MRSATLNPMPTADSIEALMLKIAGTPKRVHTHEYRRWWVESRWCRRGWYSVLWPLPIRSYDGVPRDERCFEQRSGRTLPVYCRTRDEAVEWAWKLADSLDGFCLETARHGLMG
jgi:hypothetical protein